MSAPFWSQQLPLSNASFELGENTPIDWYLSTPETGRWLGPTEGFSQRAVTAIGDGTNTSYWHSDPIQFAPNQTYAMTFYSRSLGSERGSAISGPRFCNRDLGQVLQNGSAIDLSSPRLRKAIVHSPFCVLANGTFKERSPLTKCTSHPCKPFILAIMTLFSVTVNL